MGTGGQELRCPPTQISRESIDLADPFGWESRWCNLTVQAFTPAHYNGCSAYLKS